MLYQRILTAIPLAILVFWVIFYQDSQVFFYCLLFVVLLAAQEWAKLSAMRPLAARWLFAALVTAVLWALAEFLPSYLDWLLIAAVMWWFSISYYLKKARPQPPSQRFRLDKLLVAFIVLPAAAIAMRDIHALAQGPQWLFYALSLVWVADIGAYFSGKKFGRNKLAPHISPGKTREGLLGALLATSLYTLAASFYFDLGREHSILLILMSVMVTLISVSGDLYFSFLKREVGLKDSGRILPGHGGILDRIDSVLAAMPVFLLAYQWFIA